MSRARDKKRAIHRKHYNKIYWRIGNVTFNKTSDVKQHVKTLKLYRDNPYMFIEDVVGAVKLKEWQKLYLIACSKLKHIGITGRKIFTY